MAGGVKIFSKVCKNQDLFDYEKKNAKTRICVATVMGSTTLEALGSGFYSFSSVVVGLETRGMVSSEIFSTTRDVSRNI